MLVFCGTKAWCEKSAQHVARLLGRLAERRTVFSSPAAGAGAAAAGAGGAEGSSVPGGIPAGGAGAATPAGVMPGAVAGVTPEAVGAAPLGVTPGGGPAAPQGRDVLVAELRRSGVSGPTAELLLALLPLGIAFHHSGLGAEERVTVEVRQADLRRVSRLTEGDGVVKDGPWGSASWSQQLQNCKGHAGWSSEIHGCKPDPHLTCRWHSGRALCPFSLRPQHWQRASTCRRGGSSSATPGSGCPPS